MEKAVILTDIPAHRAVIGEAKCGVYISSVNPMEIAKAIEYVTSTGILLLRNGKNRSGNRQKRIYAGKSGRDSGKLSSIDLLTEEKSKQFLL
jgi:hypothetical protein